MVDPSKTTSASRAWRRSDVWLRDISNAKRRTVASTARWKLLHYKHPKPEMAGAKEEQLAAMRCFEAWQHSLSQGMLLQVAVVEMLPPVAIKQTEPEERAARAASLARWMSWLHEAPANGLRRKHRFTRVPTGWTQSARTSGNHNELGENDDLGGPSEDQLKAIKLGQV